jgi:PAS domain S-box-containing protein
VTQLPDDTALPGSLRSVSTADGPAGRDDLAELDAAVRGRRALLETIVRDAPVIVWATDRDGVIRLADGGKLEDLGLGPDDLTGRKLGDLVFDIPGADQRRRRALAGQTLSATTEVRGVVLAVWHGPLRNAQGRVVGTIGMATDVTRRSEIEAELRAEQQLMETMIRTQERDRRLMAFEIHDGLVQYASGAQMHLETLLESGQVVSGEARDRLETALGLVRRAVGEGRRLIGGLRPPVLDEMGVVAALEHLVQDQPAAGPKIKFVADVQFDRLEPLLEVTIYRIVQEAITNVRRHSRSEEAEVRVVQNGDRVRIDVRDWGVGFDPAVVTEKRLGLQGIRERVRLHHGWARIESAPGEGTRVLVDLPLAGAPNETAMI